ncbi:MAG: hypothetical protein WAO19_05915 [Candidatus Kryptoniota bacterium]
MKTDTRADLKIIGDSSSSGGHYNSAKVIGDCIVNGNLDCVRFKCVGNSKINGDVETKEAKIIGSTSITGFLKSDNIRVTGNVDVNGDINSKDIVIRGGVDTKGGIKSDEIRIKGYVTIKKNCEAEIFRSEGPLAIGGLLNAESIEIRIHSICKITEIGGERIDVRRGHGSKLERIFKSIFLPADFYGGKLVTDCIEGDQVRLEYTKAKVVRGKNVVIGDGCEIDLVEYAEECRINGHSAVKQKKNVRK